jgi:predicted transcriptional regulator
MQTDLNKKEKAIKLRKKGKSIREIEKILGIARSTLSDWLKNVKLSKEQIERLERRRLANLAKGRAKALLINKTAKLERIKKIQREVKKFMSEIKINKKLGELIFAIFYLAEGTKRENSITFANSDPNLLKAFLNLFRYLYRPNESRFRCCLHLRKDQPEEKLKNYWSRILKIPKSQFHKTQFDKRTIKPTFKDYKGVCVIIYFDINLQRRLLYLAENLIQRISKI